MKINLEVDIKIRGIIEVDDSQITDDMRAKLDNGGQIVRDEDRQAVIAEIADMFCVKPEDVHMTHEDVRGVINEKR